MPGIKWKNKNNQDLMYSGTIVVGGVCYNTLRKQGDTTNLYKWYMTLPGTTEGFVYTVEEAKQQCEQAFYNWIKKASLIEWYNNKPL